MGGNPSRVRVSGPLEAYVSGFRSELARVGYTENAMADQLRLLAHLSRWLASQGLAAAEVTPAVCDRFLNARRDAGYALWLSRKGVRPLLEYLRKLEAVPPEPVVALTLTERLIDQYPAYLTARLAACLPGEPLIMPTFQRHLTWDSDPCGHNPEVGIMIPASLMTGSRKDFVQRRPQAKRAVADRQQWRLRESAVLE